MKKIVYSIAVISALAVAFASCQKEEKNIITKFGAHYDNETPAEKTAYNEGVFGWSANDKVKVFDNEEHSGLYTVHPGSVNPYYASIVANETTVTEESAPYIGIFPASAAINKNTLELPTVQHSSDGQLMNVPMYAVTDNDQMRFKNLCGALRIRLHQDGINVRRIVLTTEKIINGRFDVTLDEDNIPSLTPSSQEIVGYTVNGSYTTALICDESQDIGGEGHIFYLYLPAGTYEHMTLTLYNDEGKITSKSAQNVTITRSKYTKVAIDGGMTFADPQGAIKNGLFSIRPDRRVRFSKGNLQYHPRNNEWRFADEQTEVLNTRSLTNLTANSNVWIDLFPFATSGYDGKLPYNRTNNYLHTGYYSTVRNIVGTQYDWGLHNPISNGANSPGLWFTMSSSEWGYLMFCRPNALVKHGIGMVQNSAGTYVKGLIILPDEFVYPTGCDELPMNTYEEQNAPNATGNWGYDRISYTHTQWSQMEENGAAFLPAAGYFGTYYVNNQSRWGLVENHPQNNQPYGFYWTSTRWLRLADVNYSSAGYQSVITMAFQSGRTQIGQYLHRPGLTGSVNPDMLLHYYYSCSVRLVQDENMVNVMPEYYAADDHTHTW